MPHLEADTDKLKAFQGKAHRTKKGFDLNNIKKSCIHLAYRKEGMVSFWEFLLNRKVFFFSFLEGKVRPQWEEDIYVFFMDEKVCSH